MSTKQYDVVVEALSAKAEHSTKHVDPKEARRLLVRLRVTCIERGIPKEQHEPLFKRAFSALKKPVITVGLAEILREIIREIIRLLKE